MSVQQLGHGRWLRYVRTTSKPFQRFIQCDWNTGESGASVEDPESWKFGSIIGAVVIYGMGWVGVEPFEKIAGVFNFSASGLSRFLKGSGW